MILLPDLILPVKLIIVFMRIAMMKGEFFPTEVRAGFLGRRGQPVADYLEVSPKKSVMFGKDQ